MKRKRLKHPNPIDIDAMWADVARADAIVEKARHEPMSPEDAEALRTIWYSLYNQIRFPDPER